MPRKSQSLSAPKSMQATVSAVSALTDAVCAEHLDAEYAELARRLAATLSRKRPSPLAQGQAKSWAAGILYALGQVNFLSDKAQTPHMRMADLCKVCGVHQNTAATKAQEIRRLLKISVLDPSWTRPSKLDSNPMAWTITVNGYIMDARYAPLEVQLIAYQKGLIPYIPSLGPGSPEDSEDQ
jgi:hypothetical protein